MPCINVEVQLPVEIDHEEILLMVQEEEFFRDLLSWGLTIEIPPGVAVIGPACWEVKEPA